MRKSIRSILGILIASSLIVTATTVIAGKPAPKFPDAWMYFGDGDGDRITSDGLGTYFDRGRTYVGINPNDGSVHVASGSERAFCFDFSQCVSGDADLGLLLSGCHADSAISIWTSVLHLEPGEWREVRIRARINGKVWWLHWNSPRHIAEPYVDDPNPPTVTAYDLDGSEDGISDTWVTEVTADTSPVVLYELVKVRGRETKVERGRFIMPFTMTVVLDR